jgi:hypothetical protein
VGLTPWALHIGGRFTPLTEWDGYGPVQGSNGGHYALFTPLRGGVDFSRSTWGGCSFTGCDNLKGTARLYSFHLAGAVHAWLSTSGARTTLVLDAGHTHLSFPVSFQGRWHGPVLRVANSDDAFTQVFTPRGAIRSVTSTADSGHAAGALRFGSQAGLDVACTALAR